MAIKCFSCLPCWPLTSTGFSSSTGKKKNLLRLFLQPFRFELQITCLGFVSHLISFLYAQYFTDSDVFNPARHIQLKAKTFNQLICWHGDTVHPMCPHCLNILEASRCTTSITWVSIRMSAVLAKGSQTAGGPGAIVSKQTGVIRRVEERIKQRIQRVRRAAQWAVRAVGAGAAVARRGSVGRGGGGSVAGRCQRSHC